MRMRRVGVINSGNTGNCGVMAMILGLQRGLQELAPDIELVIATDHPHNREKDTAGLAARGVRALPNRLGDLLFRHYWVFAFVALSWLLARLVRSRSKGGEEFDVRDCDAIVSLCGEDFFSDNWPWRTALFTFVQCFNYKLSRRDHHKPAKPPD